MTDATQKPGIAPNDGLAMTESDASEAELAKKFLDAQDAIEEVHYRFRMFTTAKDMLNRAHHLTELANAVADLQTWHLSHDTQTGTLGWEREDVD